MRLPLTGERTLPGIWHENYWFRRHEAAYLAVAEYLTVADTGEPAVVPGSVLLEAGCGEGYGAALLRQRTGARVAAFDYDAASLDHVAATYPDVQPVRANLVALPVGDAVADAVVSMQVVEHLWDQEAFVTECARVLRPGGTLVMSTPNRVTFSPAGAPRNPFHARELDAGELRALVSPSLDVVRVDGLDHGRRLDAAERDLGDLVRAQAASPPDTWPAALHGLVASVTVEDFVLASDDLDASRDLVLVAVRPAP
ncbi:MAG: class I SAM-dependent methyltransferase [Actinomycetes bacterium]